MMELEKEPAMHDMHAAEKDADQVPIAHVLQTDTEVAATAVE